MQDRNYEEGRGLVEGLCLESVQERLALSPEGFEEGAGRVREGTQRRGSERWEMEPARPLGDTPCGDMQGPDPSWLIRCGGDLDARHGVCP